MTATMRNTQDPHPYALGYSESEFRRLEQQGAYFRDLTDDVLRRAGVEPGMHVLVVGCGVGDVSLLAGMLVGPTGAVLGIDRSAEAIEVARRRAVAAGQASLRFEAVELDAFSTERKFDAVIGRLVLMYLPDPAATLRRLRLHLRRGGAPSRKLRFRSRAASPTRHISANASIGFWPRSRAPASRSTWAENCSQHSWPQGCRRRK
jgi:SAM-dependent methyltransferase